MKTLLCLALFASLTLCAPSAVQSAAGKAVAGGDHNNVVEKLTGVQWQATPQELKKALLLGVESAVIIEFYINEEQKKLPAAERRRTPLHNLSPFEKGWAQVFKGVSSEEIAERIDAWYAAHPDKLDRPVFAVLWYELIAPHYTPAAKK